MAPRRIPVTQVGSWKKYYPENQKNDTRKSLGLPPKGRR